jgi:3-hydroxyisobutyrate dehydrogenase-like beta-hydroxyacid dehydrogenase
MGTPIAVRLHEAGWRVMVCDRDEQTLARLARSGLTTVREPARCAGVDVVLVLVSTPQQVHDVLLGDAGLASGIDAARPPHVAVMSTVSAESVIRLHETLLPLGARVLDAPISGGVLRAEEGTLSVMVGGDGSEIETIRPVLQAFATRVFHCGARGSGATVKIINNIVGTTSVMVMAEACRIALERGLDLAHTVRVLEASTGRTALTATEGGVAEFYYRSTQTRRDFDGLAAIVRKDLGLALGLADEVPGGYPLLGRLKEFADSMGDETFENWQAVGTEHRHPHPESVPPATS